MKQRGFTMIEMALVILIGGIVMSGLMQILQTSIAARTNQINNDAAETTKTAVVLSSLSSKTTASQCVAGTCSGLIATLDCAIIATPCRVYVFTYPLPAAATVEKDFWGNDLTYTRLFTPVASGTAPATLVFKLVSKGPDATAGTTDDITYNVTAAEFLMRVSRMGL